MNRTYCIDNFRWKNTAVLSQLYLIIFTLQKIYEANDNYVSYTINVFCGNEDIFPVLRNFQALQVKDITMSLVHIKLPYLKKN